MTYVCTKEVIAQKNARREKHFCIGSTRDTKRNETNVYTAKNENGYIAERKKPSGVVFRPLWIILGPLIFHDIIAALEGTRAGYARHD